MVHSLLINGYQLRIDAHAMDRTNYDFANFRKGPIPLSGERLRMFANYANYLRNTHSLGGMDEWFIPP